MAKKSETVFVCQHCGGETPKWQGRCPACGEWNSLVEEKVIAAANDDKRRRTGTFNTGKASGNSKAEKLSEVRTGIVERVDTGIPELNRVLGGGMVRGSLTLISGEPGIGKSTLIIQAASEIAEKKGVVLYVSGEESEEQIKIRADRVCRTLPGNLFILSETNMENISAAVEKLSPVFIIIDSIQTLYTCDLESAPGSVSQVRACAGEIMRIGKGMNIPVFLVAHVTKSGDLAGPKIIEHLVDCVLNFSGERNRELRILRSYKNRFGTTSEIGAFEMSQDGLVEINNLSGAFLEGMSDDVSGSAAAAVYEGTRPLLLEVQALTSSNSGGFPRRTAIGIDVQRLNMIIAVMERKAKMTLSDKDVYVNIVGGIKPEGTSTDLAVAVAIHSAFYDKSVGVDTLVIGEIGLTGELRAVQNTDKILKEASRLGFKRIIMPKSNAQALTEIPKGIKVTGVRHLVQALERYQSFS